MSKPKPKPPGQNAGSDDLEHKKKRLECEKLEAEAAKAKAETDVARRSQYGPTFFTGLVSAVVTVGVAVTGLWFTNKNGWFDANKRMLEADNKYLLAQKETITMENIRLALVRSNMNAEMATMEARLRDQVTAVLSMTNKLVSLERAVFEKENLVSNLNMSVASLVAENQTLKPLADAVGRLEKERDVLIKFVTYEPDIAVHPLSNGIFLTVLTPKTSVGPFSAGTDSVMLGSEYHYDVEGRAKVIRIHGPMSRLYETNRIDIPHEFLEFPASFARTGVSTQYFRRTRFQAPPADASDQ